MKTTKQIGAKLEEYVAYLFKDIYPYARPTKASGARNENGDVQQPYFVIECKHRTTENITIKEKIWNKLCNQTPISGERLPLYILRNKNNRQWAVLQLEDFIKIFKNSLKNE